MGHRVGRPPHRRKGPSRASFSIIDKNIHPGENPVNFINAEEQVMRRIAWGLILLMFVGGMLFTGCKKQDKPVDLKKGPDAAGAPAKTE